MIIRQLQACDRHALITLLEKEHGQYINKDIDLFDNYIMAPNQYTFVGFMDNSLVATHTVTIEEKLIHNHGLVAHMEDLVVRPDYRERGLAKRMLEYSLEFCKQHGAYKILATCTEKNVEYYNKTIGLKVHEISLRRDL